MTTNFSNTFKDPWVYYINEALDLPREICIDALTYLRISRTLEMETREWGVKSIINTAKVAHASIELTVDAYGLEPDDFTLLINRGFSQMGDCFNLDIDASNYEVVCEYEGIETPTEANIDLILKTITLS